MVRTGSEVLRYLVDSQLPVYELLTVVRNMKELSVWIGGPSSTQFFGEESKYGVKNGEICRDRTPTGP